MATQFMERREATAARGEHLFGDLEIETRGLDAGFLRRIGHVFGETLGREVLATDVDRQTDVSVSALGQCREIAKRAPQDPAAELHRQAR
jgi:hypothetical protein